MGWDDNTLWLGIGELPARHKPWGTESIAQCQICGALVAGGDGKDKHEAYHKKAGELNG